MLHATLKDGKILSTSSVKIHVEGAEQIIISQEEANRILLEEYEVDAQGRITFLYEREELIDSSAATEIESLIIQKMSFETLGLNTEKIDDDISKVKESYVQKKKEVKEKKLKHLDGRKEK